MNLLDKSPQSHPVLNHSSLHVVPHEQPVALFSPPFSLSLKPKTMPENNAAMNDGMQCRDHPFMNSTNTGGICPFCLQEKLGKLISSSPSFQPNTNTNTNTNRFFFSDRSQVAAHTSSSYSSSSSPLENQNPQKSTNPNETLTKNKIQFLIAQKKIMAAAAAAAASDSTILKRTRSISPNKDDTLSWINTTPRTKSFWSFLYSKKRGREKEKGFLGKENDSPNISSDASSFVGRSRSVGCGSRSFSGDFLDKISTGFGDCALRRVESQREPANHGKIVCSSDVMIKERVKCGGFFPSFGTSSSWVSEDFNGGFPRSRSKNWGWAFTSPMRAFRPTKPLAISRKDYGK